MSIELGDEMQIRITFWDKDQDMVAPLVNFMLVQLDEINNTLSMGKAHENRVFIEGRIAEIQDTLSLLQAELVKLMKDEELLAFEEQVKAGVLMSGEILSSIYSKEVELEVARYSLDASSPQIAMLERELRLLREKNREISQGSGSGKGLLPRFEVVPELKVKLEELQLKFEYYTQVLAFMGPQYEQAKIDEIKDIPSIQVLDYANRPDKKDKPFRALLVVVFCGIGFVFLASGIIIYETEIKQDAEEIAEA